MAPGGLTKKRRGKDEEWREQMLLVQQLLQLVERWLAASSRNAAGAALSIRASVRQREQHMAVQTRGSARRVR